MADSTSSRALGALTSPRTLGALSLALGLPQVIAPRAVAERLGVIGGLNDAGVTGGVKQAATTRGVGVRELLAGGLLLARPTALGLWGRVAGDAMDVTMLSRALRRQGSSSLLTTGRGGHVDPRTVGALAAVLGIAALDVAAALRRSTGRGSGGGRRALVVTGTTTIAKPAGDVYAAWRRFERLPEFLAHLDRVDVSDARHSHWVAEAPFGRPVEWDAEVTEDQPGERISWQSLPGADVPNSGTVSFRPAPSDEHRDQGTEITVTLRYEPPAGRLGAAVARYFGQEPNQSLDDDLRRFKQVLETGEVMRSDGAPWGKLARHEFPQRPAQPLPQDELQRLRDAGHLRVRGTAGDAAAPDDHRGNRAHSDDAQTHQEVSQ
ncbi:MAG: SRPBCC family protein [Actinomycetales bacterium]